MKKFNIENSYKKSLNIIVNSLFNKELRNSLFKKKDSELIKNFEILIGYQNYIENNVLNNNNHISLKLAQIVSNFCNKSIKLSTYKNINENFFEININFLATYLHNIFNINKENIVKNYKINDIDNLFSESKTFLKNLFNKEQKNKKDIKNNVISDPLNKDFYPYQSKPKIVIILKYIISGLNLLVAFLLLIFFIYGLLSHNNSAEFNLFLWIIFFGILSYFFFKMTNSKIARIKYIFPKINYFITIFINLIFVFYLFLLWKGSTDSFVNIFASGNLFLSIINIFLILINFSILIISTICYFHSPIIDQNKINKLRDQVLKNQKNFLHDNNIFNNNNDEDSENNKD